ncbi:MAG: GatB/YqeY domain-containing protein [Candidatus Moraniibacteriota bacterium]
MSLISQISEELKTAMKSGDTLKRDTLRMLQSAVKNVAIENRKEAMTMTDAEVQDVVKRLVKQRKDSVLQYRAGGREELAAKEESEIALLSAYLPEMLSEEQTATLVDKILAELGEVTPKDMGRVMGVVMKKAEGKADGGIVRSIVASRLK